MEGNINFLIDKGQDYWENDKRSVQYSVIRTKIQLCVSSLTAVPYEDGYTPCAVIWMTHDYKK